MQSALVLVRSMAHSAALPLGGQGTLCSHCHPLAALAPSPQPGAAFGDIPMLGSELLVHFFWPALIRAI